jgi:hypothetical protein
LVEQPYEPWLLGATAAGLIVYNDFPSFWRATDEWRQVNASQPPIRAAPY